MSTTAQTDVQGKDSKKTTASEWAKNEEAYAKINKEVAAMVTDADKIVFGPAEDFEYKAPLEDFKKTRQGSS